jgi:hypothetical protein
MKKRGSRVGSGLGAGLSSRGLALAVGFALSGLSACGSDAGGEGAPAEGAPAQEPSTVDVAPAAGAPVSSSRYQFVETPEGMTVEAFGSSSVQTLSCGVRSCLGLCDECALAACRAAGDLESVCAALVASCSETCNCDSGGPNCGFPVCAFDRQLCYIGEGFAGASPGDGPAGDGPSGPNPDPSPEVDPASNPSGSGASQPAPVP